MIKGDIAQFAPADLLLFLCHMSKEGVLTVRHEDASLSLTFRRDGLVDGQCEAADRLVLEQLEHHGATTPETMEYLRRAGAETDLPLRQILGEVEWLSVGGLEQAMAAGLKETVFRLLLWERGEFQFHEFAVDPNPFLPPCDGPSLVMDLTREVDEYRELLSRLGSLERVLVPAGDHPAESTDAAEQYILQQAHAGRTALDLIASAPYPQMTSIRALATSLANGWVDLAVPADQGEAAGVVADPATAYRQSLRRLLTSGEPQARIREILQYGQEQLDVTVLLAQRDGALVRASIHDHDAEGRPRSRDRRQFTVDPSQAPSLSDLAEAIPAPTDEMAACGLLADLELTGIEAPGLLIPLGQLGGHDLLVLAYGETTVLAWFESLAWQVQPPLPVAAPVREPDAEDTSTTADDSGGDALTRLVASIKDLPPMPHMIARILDLLADPDCQMNTLSEALAHEPALVAKLIKVSNSTLYGGGQESRSLSQAVVRLGTRTTRSVVVAASTRTLFPTDNTRIGYFGKALWQHAVEAGIASRRVAEFVRHTDPDEAFVGGVLHDLGKLIILLNQPDTYRTIHRRLESGDVPASTVERELLGFDHGLVGARLLESWGMPDQLQACARHHHAPEEAGGHVQLARIVACGDLLSHSLGAMGEGRGTCVEQRLIEAGEALGLDEEGRADLMTMVAFDLEQSDMLD